MKNSKFPPKEERLKRPKKLLLIRVKLSEPIIRSVLNRVRFDSGSGCPFSVHFRLGHYGSGLNWVRSFRVRVILGHATIRVSFGLWIGLVQVFGSESVHPISGVGSGSFSLCFGSRISFGRSNDSML